MRPLAIAILASLLLAAPSNAQFIENADVWCIQHHPCDWSAHTAGTVAGTLLLDAITPLNASETRWIMVGYYAQREVRQIIKYGDVSRKDASKIVPLPLWLDAIFDMGFVAFGAWLAPRLGGPSLWQRDSRVRLAVGTRSLGIVVTVP